ncbi:MAG: hypothetical protein PVH19_02620 [Planctomycetia bacterium]
MKSYLPILLVLVLSVPCLAAKSKQPPKEQKIKGTFNIWANEDGEAKKHQDKDDENQHFYRMTFWKFNSIFSKGTDSYDYMLLPAPGMLGIEQYYQQSGFTIDKIFTFRAEAAVGDKELDLDDK